MNKNIRVALTGFMGVGKSSVARHLSNLLNCKRLDLDYFIEEHEGRKIAQIIDSDGEEKYRQMEAKWLKQALDRSDAHFFTWRRGMDDRGEPQTTERAWVYERLARGNVRSLLAEYLAFQKRPSIGPRQAKDVTAL